MVKHEYKLLGSTIRGIAWSSDNKRLAVCGGEQSKGGEAVCVAFDTGSRLGEISGHSKSINCIAYRPVPPFRIVTGGEDSHVIFHEGPPFKFLRSQQGVHTSFVNSVAFSSDGSVAFSCASDGIVAMFNGESGDVISTLNPKLSCSLWSLGVVGERTVAVACGDKKIRLLKDTSIVGEYSLGSEVRDMPMGLTGGAGQCLSVSLDGTIRAFNVKEVSLEVSQTWCGSQGAITCIIHNPTLNTYFIASLEGAVWKVIHPSSDRSNPVSVRCKKPIKGSAGIVFDPTSGFEILGVSMTNDSQLISVATGEVATQFAIPAGTSKLLACQNGGFAIGSKSTTWKNIRSSQSTTFKPNESIACFASSEDGASTGLVHAKDRSNNLSLQAEKREVMVQTLSGTVRLLTEITTADIVAVAVSNGGTFVAVASAGQELHVYERSASNEYSVVPGTVAGWTYHKARISAMQFVGNRFLVTGGLDKQVCVWDVQNAEEGPIRQLKDLHREGVTCVTAQLDKAGNLIIASGGNEGSVRFSLVESLVDSVGAKM